MRRTAGAPSEATAVQVERDTTLLRALTLAGGLTEWADRKNIRILYPDGGADRERVYDLNKIEKGRLPDPVLAGGEVIIVKKRFL